MSFDLIIPFVVLLAMVVYFIYTRSKFEKEIVKLYEEKFENWKKSSKEDKKEVECKTLVGLVYKKGYKLEIELLDDSIKDRLKSDKFTIYSIKE